MSARAQFDPYISFADMSGNYIIFINRLPQGPRDTHSYPSLIPSTKSMGIYNIYIFYYYKYFYRCTFGGRTKFSFPPLPGGAGEALRGCPPAGNNRLQRSLPLHLTHTSMCMIDVRPLGFDLQGKDKRKTK